MMRKTRHVGQSGGLFGLRGRRPRFHSRTIQSGGAAAALQSSLRSGGLATWLLLALLTASMAGCHRGMSMSKSETPAPPAAQNKEHYTILLETFVREGHAQEAERYRIETAKHTGWQGLYVVDKKDHSELYWGKYRTLKEAEKNLALAKAFTAPVGGYKLYVKAIVVPLEDPDVGSPEYNLANAQGYYTVLVAVFYDVPEASYFGRKQNAVEYCQQLRGRFQEAYYYHDPTRSAVTVGRFAKSAVRIEMVNGVEKPLIVDPRMQAVIDEFNCLAVNGRKEMLLSPIKEKRELKADPKLFTGSKEEKEQKFWLMAQGSNVGYQRPYPVMIPSQANKQTERTAGHMPTAVPAGSATGRTHERTTTPSIGDGQSGQATGNPASPPGAPAPVRRPE